MKILSKNTEYHNSGDMFSRCFYVHENREISDKHVLLFETETQKNIFLRNYEILFSTRIPSIDGVHDMLDFLTYDFGIFATTVSLYYEFIGKEKWLYEHIWSISKWETIDREKCIDLLVKNKYSHKEDIFHPGSYRIDGDIIKITLKHRPYIIYIDTFNDVVEDIFEMPLEDLNIISSKKNLSFPDFSRISPERIPFSTNISSYFSSDLVWLIGCDFFENTSFIKDSLTNFIHLGDLRTDDTKNLEIEPLKIISLVELKSALDEGIKTLCYTKNVKTLTNFIQDNELPLPPIFPLKKIHGTSFITPESIVIADDILSELFIKKRTKKSLTQRFDLLLHIRPGDYVVHVNHGIGTFKEITTKELTGKKKEYISIDYAEWDKLFVPVSELYRVSKYVGKQDPELTRLHKDQWKRLMKTANKEIEKIAEEILEHHAERKMIKGYPFISFPEKEQAFMDAFEFEYTIDQETARKEILSDMELPEPMDRLLTGDVGFGKTEVAIQSMYRCILHKKQVAFLSPLVVLAYEHYESVKERFSGMGVQIEILSRMTPQSQVERILKAVKEHKVDILIGTHKLLSPSVEFADLGLCVIDEEHKFWVQEKEKIFQIKSAVDTLSLSATPIPRSLNLALSGVRKISILGTPPSGRKTIETIVSKFNEHQIVSACEYELSRNGKIFFIHNRVMTIESQKVYLEGILGKKAKIVITHGQMSPVQMEDNIIAFKKWEYNILLSSTVIENGINFTDTNTIIINDADRFGLAQLHQLRGRVGRGDRKWYCYLFYRKNELASDAKERLITLANATHLGAGFEIATRDMEIRGAGDILGIKQSGKGTQVGVTTYLKLLEEKVRELQQGSPIQKLDCTIDIPMQAYLPDELFENDSDKIQFYRNIEVLENEQELDDMYELLVEGVLDIPEAVNDFFLILRAKILFQKMGIMSVKKIGKEYVFEFTDGIPMKKLKDFLAKDTEKKVILISSKRAKISEREIQDPRKLLQYFL